MILIQNCYSVNIKDPYYFSLCVWCECGNSVSRFATDPIYIKQPMLLVQENNQSCLPLIELVLVTTLFALLAIFFPNRIPLHPHVLKKCGGGGRNRTCVLENIFTSQQANSFICSFADWILLSVLLFQRPSLLPNQRCVVQIVHLTVRLDAFLPFLFIVSRCHQD